MCANKQQETQNIIRKTVIESITNYAKKKISAGVNNFQILDLLIPKERKIRSIVGGLETSLGTTLWEPLAYALAKKNGFVLHKREALLMPAIMPSRLARTIESLLDARKNLTGEYNAESTHSEIRRVCQVFLTSKIRDFVKPPNGFGVDIWLEKDDVNYFFDIKTVQPNVGGFKRYLEQIINWYAYFYSQWPEKKSEARIVFPYNPYNDDDFWSRSQNKGIPLERDNEGIVGNQFWDFCSGVENTYGIITNVFKSIADSRELSEVLDDLFRIK